MESETVAILGFAALFILLFIRMPVGLTMMLIGTVGIYLIRPVAAMPRWPARFSPKPQTFP
jgi:hypothetical protein